MKTMLKLLINTFSNSYAYKITQEILAQRSSLTKQGLSLNAFHLMRQIDTNILSFLVSNETE